MLKTSPELFSARNFDDYLRGRLSPLVPALPAHPSRTVTLSIPVTLHACCHVASQVSDQSDTTTESAYLNIFSPPQNGLL